MLDNVAGIAEVDKFNMREILQGFPEQCEKAVRMGGEIDIPSSLGREKVKKVLVCGLGGSAIGGDILRTLFSAAEITVMINRNYSLPSFIDEKTLIFAVSYSGNTEETISSFNQALKKGYFLFSITSGGELQRLSEENGIPYLKVPSGMPPRCAVGYLSLPMIILLERILRVELFDYQELIDTLHNLRERYFLQRETKDNLAKLAAIKLKGKMPLIYGVDGLTDVVAHRLKTQFNENSKVLASWNVFPEMNHNEVVPWSGEGEMGLEIFHPIFIRDRGEERRITHRIKVTQELIKRKGVEYSEIWTEGKSLISRVFSSIYTGDWVSFYLAILQGIDPTPIKFIDLLKGELKKLTP